jgi:hypothetical protein
MTHLTAVSGANLTLLLAFLLTVAGWVGVRGWWLRAVGLAGVLVFVALCRTEPSVLRAAVLDKQCVKTIHGRKPATLARPALTLTIGGLCRQRASGVRGHGTESGEVATLTDRSGVRPQHHHDHRIPA